MRDCLSSRKAEDIQKDINIRKLFSNSQVIQKPEIKKLKKKRNNNQGRGGGNGNHADNEDNNDSDSSVDADER